MPQENGEKNDEHVLIASNKNISEDFLFFR